MKKYYLSAFLLSLSFSLATVSAQQVVDTDTSGEGSSCITINNNLSYKNRASNSKDDVMNLQDYLNSAGYLNANSVTGFFGKLTEKAVAKFQKENGLLANPAGFVGAGTRAKILALSCGGQTGHVSSNGNILNNKISINDVKVGDTFGDLKVVSSEINSYGTRINFSGNMIVTGSLGINEMTGSLILSATKEGGLQIPKFKGDENSNGGFCLTGDIGKIVESIANIKNMTVEVKNYSIYIAGKGGCSSSAELVRIIGQVSKNDSVSNNSNLPQGCKSTEGFSPLTGVRCSATTEVNNTLKSVTLLSPLISSSGNQVVKPGTYDIKWKALNIEDISIVIKEEGGKVIVSSGSVKASLGSYSIQIPEVVTTKGVQPKYSIVLFDSENKIITKSNPFVISCSACAGNYEVYPVGLDPVTVLSPNGGETFKAGGVLTVRWNGLSNVRSLEIALTTETCGKGESGLICNVPDFYKSYLVVNNGRGFEDLEIPLSAPSSNRYKIIIADTIGMGSKTTDMSDGFFEVVK